jgi:excisionase family DNA binding protein
MTDADAGPTMSRVMRSIPDPAICPTVSVEEAAQWCGLGRSAAYEAVRRGELPVLRFGRSLRVPTALLRQMLGLKESEPIVPVVPLGHADCDQSVTSRIKPLVSAIVSTSRGTDNHTPEDDQ